MNEEEEFRAVGEGRPTIIAMKGHPGSGKSTLARSIARALRCPLLDKDDVRDSTFPLQQQLSAQPQLLNALSYDALWRLASSQLRLGLTVVLDSPLSSPSHLETLRRLASASAASLLVVECCPSDHSEWRRRLERRALGGEGHGSSWHKPSTWQDLQRLLKEYDGRTNYHFGDVPRLVVDTTAPVGLREMLSAALEFIAAHAAARHSRSPPILQ